MVTQIQRISQIVEILGKYGFGMLLEELFPHQSRVRFPRRGTLPEPSTMYERVRLATEELGPTFVKFGQIMSTRTDVLPAALIAELRKLQDQVKPVPFDEIHAVIDECCPDHEELFLEIEETPLASASIAQVHRAVLRDGTTVALKIQRPGIEEVIETDLLILQSMAERVEQAFPDARLYNPVGIVKDFSHQIRKELDFLEEARTAERMRQNFSNVPGIHFPAIYRDYSSPRLLVMEYVKGVRIDDLDALSALGLDPHAIGKRGFFAYLKMIFEDGFFHGDPHPGNLLVTKEGTIVVLDFGIAGAVRPEKRREFISFLFSLINEDTELMVRSLKGLGVVIPDKYREPLQDDLFVLIHDLGIGYTISRFNFGLFTTELAEVMRRYRIRVPANLMLLLKVLVMVLDTGTRLDPEFNIKKELSPYLQRIAGQNTFSAASAQRVSVAFLETADAVFDTPRHLNLMLRRFSTGTMRLDIIDTDIRKFQEALDDAGDKFLLGIVVGSLVIGSSLILKAAPLAIPAEVSLLAVIGYGAAALAGFYAVYHILYMKFRQER